MQLKTLDIRVFLDELMAEMHMEHQPEKDRIELRDAMENQVNAMIMSAVSNNIEGAVIDEVMKRYENEGDSDFIFAELVANSPSAQIAILQALETFKEQMLDAYKSLENVN